jgi:hypothetical protein
MNKRRFPTFPICTIGNQAFVSSVRISYLLLMTVPGYGIQDLNRVRFEIGERNQVHFSSSRNKMYLRYALKTAYDIPAIKNRP